MSCQKSIYQFIPGLSYVWSNEYSFRETGLELSLLKIMLIQYRLPEAVVKFPWDKVIIGEGCYGEDSSFLSKY